MQFQKLAGSSPQEHHFWVGPGSISYKRARKIALARAQTSYARAPSSSQSKAGDKLQKYVQWSSDRVQARVCFRVSLICISLELLSGHALRLCCAQVTVVDFEERFNL